MQVETDWEKHTEKFVDLLWFSKCLQVRCNDFERRSVGDIESAATVRYQYSAIFLDSHFDKYETQL